MINDLRLSVPCAHTHSRLLRESIREWLGHGPFDNGLVDDVLLAASELFANAVSSTSEDSDIQVSLCTVETSVILEVANPGQGFDLSSIVAPSSERPRGRGLAIVGTFGNLAVNQHDGQTFVSVTIR